MKFYLVLGLCVLAANAAPSLEYGVVPESFDTGVQSELQQRNFLVNALVNTLFTYLRHVINNGSILLGFEPLDPLRLGEYHLTVPAQIINLDLQLKNIVVAGLGGFVVHTSNLDLRTMTFDVRITVPRLDISADEYDLTGDLYGAIPLFGKGSARFQIDDLTFAGKLFLKQSEDKNSVLIERIETATFVIPTLRSQLTGVIGGGDIDAIVNAIIEEVFVAYVNRFQAIISSQGSSLLVRFGNPLLDQLDTWRWIAPLIPRS